MDLIIYPILGFKFIHFIKGIPDISLQFQQSQTQDMIQSFQFYELDQIKDTRITHNFNTDPIDIFKCFFGIFDNNLG